MTLIAITQPFDRGTVWINPDHVQCVEVAPNIRRGDERIDSKKITGTRIIANGLHAIETTEAIESVVRRLQGGE